ncbi:late competence development ComFB family protein [Serpentinicella alkaliphila]|uniref:Competence protein ComFB n=1 Tax=Serpentinicella alkaliphila TaxID=1734049 RepID=A0A4R2TJC7_9FIRM|nr:late competence development ComFB family protein [Serpentinicella alkaliphila]QUH26653.1 late competence development ComFB family protein [Serpentinicella alkaliphila]TCQ02876.1 competence protein ComFB [Serpentinicella alkaliphila]
MPVKNHMEDVVNFLMPNIMKNFEGQLCQCERCIADIKALALNELEPRYFTSDTGQVFFKVKEMSIQFETDVTRAVLLAIDKVKNYPKHN